MTYQRVVSLVPSVTESLFELGLGSRVVGITDYCVHPASQLQHLPRLGGTKDARVVDIIALAPDLVIANREENTRPIVEALQAARLPVWVTFPETVRDAIDLLWDIIRRFDVPQQGHRLAALEKVYEWAEAASENQTPARVFCPIWKTADWWMTINGSTYVSDLLRVCGGQNVFSERERRYPLAADLAPEQPLRPEADVVVPQLDTRYPRVTLDEILAAQPEVILLPSEPYAFTQTDLDYWMQFTDLPAVQNNHIHLVDGSLLTWHGTRLAKALQEIPSLLL
jgi:ABC-type Fe3+-hydroxamate transport system substrate-binding protein